MRSGEMRRRADDPVFSGLATGRRSAKVRSAVPRVSKTIRLLNCRPRRKCRDQTTAGRVADAKIFERPSTASRTRANWLNNGSDWSITVPKLVAAEVEQSLRKRIE